MCTLSSFGSPLVKTDYLGAGQAENQVTCKEERMGEEGGEMLIVFHLQAGFRMMTAGGGGKFGCVCSLT